ncbi:hypothetical protein EV641_102267 [Rhodococcus sp. SMB37]|nr:hypothetical protein EV641_102267 [Rhodococcus sp. SMB37]
MARLPTTRAPTTLAQWQRVRFTAALPPHLDGRPVTQWHLPTLTLDGRGLLLRCAATEVVPADDLAAGTIAVGVDWSPSTLGAAATVTDSPEGLVSDYQGYTYDDRGLGIKLPACRTKGNGCTASPPVYAGSPRTHRSRSAAHWRRRTPSSTRIAPRSAPPLNRVSTGG